MWVEGVRRSGVGVWFDWGKGVEGGKGLEGAEEEGGGEAGV